MLELEKAKNADNLDGDPSELIESIEGFLASIKWEKGGPDIPAARQEAPAVQQYYLPSSRAGGTSKKKGYEAVVYFEDGCEMENIRAYAIIHNLKDIAEELCYSPANIIEKNESVQLIREHGFTAVFRTDKSYREVQDLFTCTAFIRDLELLQLDETQVSKRLAELKNIIIRESDVKMPELSAREQTDNGQSESGSSHQSIISVDVVKLDKLMDLMGEMVIAEAMVTQNPELRTMQLNSFYKAARQLRKITGELQDMVMSIRMVPLSATFRKMYRIVRDMDRKLGKEVELKLVGEETEVDKNIIEHISDPLMHLVRNCVDHGIEAPGVREAAGKPREGRIILEAKNAGSEVIVTISDDGNGLDRDKILQKAMEQGLINESEHEITDREIYNLILLPGFSTNDHVTEFSGRGVGMDVVTKNLEAIGGLVSIDSRKGTGTVTTLKIPLTLAIIDGMNIRVGDAKYTLPITSIQETFQAKERDIVRDPDDREMIMVRGQCYPILRLHKLYGVNTDITDLAKGIMLMVEQDGKSLCLFADELLGQQQVVVKALPDYIKKTKKIEGLAGCTLLGDGSISLIINIGGLFSMKL